MDSGIQIHRILDFVKKTVTRPLLGEKIITKLMECLRHKVTKNLPKMTGINIEKIYNFENVPILNQKQIDEDILPDLTLEDMEHLIQKKLSKATVNKFASIMLSIYCQCNMKINDV